MKILPVYASEFRHYGQIVENMEQAAKELMTALQTTPQPADGVDYVPEDPTLQELPAMEEVSERLYGGMPVQLGWCNGHNTKLNCLEYHRDSEYNLGAEDFVLLLAKQSDIVDGVLDTTNVHAFWVPAGVLVEVYATTLHYAPCDFHHGRGFRVMVALPKGTNTDKPHFEARSWEERLLWARNKWLLAHPDSHEAAQGAYVGLVGENIDIAELL